MSRRGTGGSDGKDKRGGDHRPKRDRRRRRTGLGGMGWGVNLHFRSFDRGVSVLQPLIGSLVECCSVLTSVSLSQHRNIVR